MLLPWEGAHATPEVNLQSCLLLTAASALRSDQVAQCFIPLGLENLPGWGLRRLPQ